ncbi:hypothetical protein BM1_10352 [Bipolaris maydis]|nr:hypothetical protein BM1_10352 [Bipolaris maydis]
MYVRSYYCCYPSIATDSQAASLRAILNGDPPVPGFVGDVGPLRPNARVRVRARVSRSPHSAYRHYSSLAQLDAMDGHGVGTPTDGAVLCDSMLPCVKPPRAASGACSASLRRPAPQQSPAWTKASQRRRAVRGGSRWLHASKARGVRGDPGCAAIEMGSIGRSTAGVRPFRLASAAALARPPTSPPQLTAPRQASFFKFARPWPGPAGDTGPAADTHWASSCLPFSTDGRSSAFALSSPAASASFPVAALLGYICSLAPIHAAPIGQNRSRT